MAKDYKKILLRESWHPSERELLLYANGELPIKGAAEIRTHLEGCWSCRGKQENIESSISAFMKYRNTSFESESGFPPEAELSFKARLGRLASEDNKTSLIGFLNGLVALERFLPRFSVAFLVVPLAFFLTLVLYLRLTSVSTVSAKEILERTKDAEAQTILQAPGTVVYQKLRLQRNVTAPRRAELVTWEIWRDTHQNRFSTRVDDAQGPRFIDLMADRSKGGNRILQSASVPPVLNDLREVFAVNQMDLKRPLAAASIEVWRGSLLRKSDQVVETRLPNGEKAYHLTTSPTGPLSLRTIVKMDWVVRSKDWHPVEQRLRVRGKNGVEDYELREADFAVVALNSLAPSVFGGRPLPVPPAVLGRIDPAGTVVASRKAELITVEIEAFYALHQARACLGEQIEVTRDPSGWVQVRGLVETAERKQELLATLRDLSLVRIEIRTVEEAAMAAAPTMNQEVSAAVSVEEPPPVALTNADHTAEVPIDDYLKRYLTAQRTSKFLQLTEKVPAILQEEMTQLTNQTISSCQVALAEAWALRRLAERYEQSEDLTRSSKWLLETMVQDHVRALKMEMENLESLVGPMLSFIVGSDSLPVLAEGREANRPKDLPEPAGDPPLWVFSRKCNNSTDGLLTSSALRLHVRGPWKQPVGMSWLPSLG